MPTLTAETLQTFAADLLRSGGATEEEAGVVSASLVDANLKGHDSHGVMRIPDYVGRLRAGQYVSGVELIVASETPAAVVADGQWGFGQVQSHRLMTMLIEKASEVGIACGTLRQAGHIGRLGEYAELAASHHMASIVTANTHGAAQRVAPPGGIRPRLGTNPICMGMPGGEGGPFVLDFGTSVTAEGKVRVRRIAGEQVPAGWLLDPDGNPTTDPNQLYGDPPGTILPMGGSQPYKGFGLALMIEMFCSGLAGAPCALENPPPPRGNAAMFIVISPECFAGYDHLSSEVARLEGYVRGVEKAPGVDHVTLPGDPERMTAGGRSSAGIVLDEGNWSKLTDLASEIGVTPPAA